MKSENKLLDLTFIFAVRIIKAYKHLVESKKEFVLSKQLLKSGTSIGANAEEANAGQTKRDFIAKLSISYKEAKETHYWIRLLRETNYMTKTEADSLLNDAQEIINYIQKSLKTAKSNLSNKQQYFSYHS